MPMPEKSLIETLQEKGLIVDTTGKFNWLNEKFSQGNVRVVGQATPEDLLKIVEALLLIKKEHQSHGTGSLIQFYIYALGSNGKTDIRFRHFFGRDFRL